MYAHKTATASSAGTTRPQENNRPLTYSCNVGSAIFTFKRVLRSAYNEVAIGDKTVKTRVGAGSVFEAAHGCRTLVTKRLECAQVRLGTSFKIDRGECTELRNVSCGDEGYLTKCVPLRMRRDIQSRTLILVEDSLNAFHHGQWLLRRLFLRLLQRVVAVVAFRKPTLRTILSKSRKEDRSKIGRRTVFLARYQQRSRSKATRKLQSSSISKMSN